MAAKKKTARKKAVSEKKKQIRKKKKSSAKKSKTSHLHASSPSPIKGKKQPKSTPSASAAKPAPEEVGTPRPSPKKASPQKKRVRPTKRAAIPKKTRPRAEAPDDPYAHLEPEEHEAEGAYMTVGDHLEELRKRIIAILIIVTLASIAVGVFSFQLHEFLLRPFRELTHERLIMSKAYGGLLVLVKLSVLCGVLVTLPVSFSILWGFVTPAVSRKTAWIGRLVVATSAVLFWAGVAVAWFYIFPLSLRFLFQDTLLWGLSAAHPVESYYNFLFTLHVGSGVAFQLPLVLVILGALGIITMDWHSRFWKYIIVIIFFLSAVLTPPDPISQMVLGSALSLLYGLSVLVVYLIEKARR